MGCYVNPATETKEAFLEREGVEIHRPPLETDVTPDSLPVILCNNGPFTAAGVAFCASEVRAFTNPTDHRPKRYFIVPVQSLWRVSDLADWTSR
jgi:hypothetical protein